MTPGRAGKCLTRSECREVAGDQKCVGRQEKDGEKIQAGYGERATERGEGRKGKTVSGKGPRVGTPWPVFVSLVPGRSARGEDNSACR